MQTSALTFAHISAPAGPCILPSSKYGKAQRPPGVADASLADKGAGTPSKDRVLFYATHPIIKQHSEAKQKLLATNHNEKFDWDYHLYPVYVISIVDFVMEHSDSWPKDRFHSHYIMIEVEYNEPYSNNLHFIFIELPRFNKVLQNLSDESEKWAYLFQNLSRMNEVLVEFGEKYFTDLFLTAKIVNFTPDEKENTWRTKR